MNLLLRLLYVLLAIPFRRRLEPLEESVVRLRVLPNDLDLNLHMNNGRYLTLMDLGRIDLLFRTGVVGVLRRRRWNGAVASQTIRYRRALNLFQRYELRTRLAGWDDRWFFLEQRFTRGGELMALGVVKVRALGREGGIDPQVVVDATGHGRASPPLPPGVIEWLEAEELLAGKRELTRDVA